MRFESPIAFFLLPLLPLLLEAGLRAGLLQRLGLPNFWPAPPSLAFSSRVAIDELPRSLRAKLRGPLLSVLLCGAFLLLITALARPQTGTRFAQTVASGRDIMLVLDVSRSMAALDFTIDGKRVERLDVLKKVTAEFIESRKGDRMGLVLFGEHVFTQAPLTLDHQLIKNLVFGLEVGMIGDGTSLGDGIAVSLQRLREIEADSRVMVLVTDGVRTTGTLDPLDAAKIAAQLGIKIYPIGIGGSGRAPFLAQDIFGREVLQWQEVPLDAATLKQAAKITGGRYFSAKNTEELQAVYNAIDRIEEREEQTFEYVEYEEHFALFLAAGIALFLLHELLAMSVFAAPP